MRFVYRRVLLQVLEHCPRLLRVLGECRRVAQGEFAVLAGVVGSQRYGGLRRLVVGFDVAHHALVDAADAHTVLVVVLHQLFDGEVVPLVAVAESGGETFLLFKVEGVFLPRAAEVQGEADAPEGVAALFESGGFAFGHQVTGDEGGVAAVVVAVGGEPVNHLVVAQAAVAVFQVGFELAVLFAVARALFLLFVADVGGFADERRPGGVDGLRFARQLAVFQQAGEEVGVGGRGGVEVAGVVDVLRDVETKLPQGLDVGFDGVAVGFVRGEQQQVDVGGREEFSAPVAADGVEADARVADAALVKAADDAVNLRGVVGDEAVDVVIAPADVRGKRMAQGAQVVAGARGFFGERQGCGLPVGEVRGGHGGQLLMYTASNVHKNSGMTILA